MHQINGASAIEGHFADGSPTQQGTVVTADWLNTVQDEICNVITSSGVHLNTMESDDKSQLKTAIGKIIQNAIENLASKSDLIIYAKKSELSIYAKNSDLNNYLKTSDVSENSYIKWLVEMVENTLGFKYPNKSRPK